MLFVYPAIFHKENDAYWVEFPDLGGCYSSGSTIPEAMEMAQESLTGYLLSLFEHGDTIAAPSDISAYSPADGFATLVSCDINQYKETRAIKKILTIPAWLNDRAVSMGLNFSKILQEALIEKITA